MWKWFSLIGAAGLFIVANGARADKERRNLTPLAPATTHSVKSTQKSTKARSLGVELKLLEIDDKGVETIRSQLRVIAQEGVPATAAVGERGLDTELWSEIARSPLLHEAFRHRSPLFNPEVYAKGFQTRTLKLVAESMAESEVLLKLEYRERVSEAPKTVAATGVSVLPVVNETLMESNLTVRVGEVHRLEIATIKGQPRRVWDILVFRPRIGN